MFPNGTEKSDAKMAPLRSLFPSKIKTPNTLWLLSFTTASLSLLLATVLWFLLTSGVCVIQPGALEALQLGRVGAAAHAEALVLEEGGVWLKERHSGFKRPRDLCGLSKGEVDRMVAQPHECKRNANRVYLDGSWVTSVDMLYALWPPVAEGADPAVCVVYCFDHEAPCYGDRCLIPVNVRRNTTDPSVAKELLEHGEFDMMKPGMGFKTILDAGANCGIASLIFSLIYPKAKIISVEPASGNYRMLQLNTQQFGNVIPVHAGLWPRIAALTLTQNERVHGAYEWSFMAFESDKVPYDRKVVGTMQGVSVDFLIEFFNLPGFDFLKIDIEGSEFDLFQNVPENPKRWLDAGKLSIIETHDDMRKGSNHESYAAFWLKPEWEYLGKWGEYHAFKRKDFDLKA